MKKTTYLLNNRSALFILKMIDTFLRWKGDSIPPLKRSIKKILLCNGAHLGDVVLSTAIIPLIQRQYPDAEIGFLAGSWSQDLLVDHCHIHRVHYLDHWKLNRSKWSLYKKIGHYFRQRKSVLKELLAVNYDVAIDLYPFFPNAIPLLYQAKISCRVGYTSGGFGSLLTHPLHWEDKKQSVLEFHRDLLLHGGLVGERSSPLLPVLDYVKKEEIKSKCPEKYCIFHGGAGLQTKEWPQESWRELLSLFVAEGRFVVFTGQGSRENSAIKKTVQGISNTLNLCDTLNLRELIEVIKKAELLITVDSVAGHIASAFGVPTIVLFSGINREEQWKPQHAESICLSHNVPCSPCLKKLGCASMGCIREIRPDQVMQAAKKWEHVF